MGMHRYAEERGKTNFEELSHFDWSDIFSIPFPKSTRQSMGLLFIHNGKGNAREILQGTWSRAMLINRLFTKHGLPYRLKTHPILKETQLRNGYPLDTLELTLCKVFK